ncbi:MAG: hypothetical protein KI791_23235 [Cyclobacteriaceae bacterium]|nr:hypothetical protein [Cyclobacteriaceae bacterium SS2]
MHQIEPYYNWLNYYDSSEDPESPFYGKEYNYDLYSENIYGYFIDPGWDYMGSETLYIKILYTNYDEGVTIIEMLGEWNDALNNDIMHFKRNVIEYLNMKGIDKFILIGENILNFHGSDDCYYEEWMEELDDGWIVAINFRDFVIAEMSHYNVDAFINFGGTFDILNWRTYAPMKLYALISEIMNKRLSAPTGY